MNGAVHRVFGDVKLEALRRILLVRLDNLGDVLLTTPAFRAVRQALPGAHLALVAGPAGCEVGRLNPDIDETILYHAPNEDVYFRLPQDPERELAAVKALEERDFDAAIIFTSYKQSALPAAYLCYLAGIPLRAAGSFEGPGSLLTHRHRYEETVPPKHESLRGLQLTDFLGFASVEPEMVLVTREEGVARLLERHGAERFILVHPGASASSRAYPPERYKKVVEELYAGSGLPVLVTGGPGEEDLTYQIAGSAGIPVGGETGFGEFAALVGRAAVVVTNNTGTTHVASALKKPVVTVFAGTNPHEQWGRGALRTSSSPILFRALRATSASAQSATSASPASPPRPSSGRHYSCCARPPCRRPRSCDEGGEAGSIPRPVPRRPRRRDAGPTGAPARVPAGAEISLVTLPWAIRLAPHLPYVDRLIPYPGAPGLEGGGSEEDLEEFLARMRTERFDLAVNMHGRGPTSTRLVARFEARRIAGFIDEKVNDVPALDIETPWNAEAHELRKLLLLAQKAGGVPAGPEPELRVREEDDRRARALLPASLHPEPLALVHPGASVSEKRWPEEAFGQVAEGLNRRGYALVVTGSAGEKELTRLVSEDAPGALDLSGETDLSTSSRSLRRRT